MNDIVIKGARVVDPTSNRDEISDLMIHDGRLVDPAELHSNSDEAPTADVHRIDGRGLIAVPGFIDVYARLREPGFSSKGTIASESTAALKAGFTSVLCTPDTRPVIDSTATVQWIAERAAQAGGARILPMAALTAGLQGEHLAELGTLRGAGCVAASQADHPVVSSRVLMRAMEYAASFNLPLILTPLDTALAGNGCAHAGALATRLGLPSIPVAAETIATSMLLELCRTIGCPLHLARLSSARAVEMLHEAKQAGLPVTASVGIHHLFFTDEQLAGYDARFLSAVPFRSVADRDALRAAVVSGVIDCICSDHAPLDTDARLAPFPVAEPGLSAYDTFLPLLMALENLLEIPLAQLIARVTTGPAALLATPAVDTCQTNDAPGSLRIGARADLALIDTEGFEAIDGMEWASAGQNSPMLSRDDLHGVTGERIALQARVGISMVGGDIRWESSSGGGARQSAR